MRYNVMQVIHDLNYGGMQRVVVDLCSQIDKNQFKMHVCCLEEYGPNIDEINKIGIPSYLIKKKPGIDYSLPFRLRDLFNDNEIHVVHTHGENPYFYGTIGAALNRVKVMVHTDHARGIFPVKRKEMFSEFILSWLTDKIVAVSSGVKEDLVKYEHISSKKILVINNGIDGNKYKIKIDAEKKKAELGIEGDKTVIGTTVRLAEQKGLKYLIEAARMLKENNEEFQIIIVGDGKLRNNLEKQTQEYGLDNQIIFTGFRSDIPEIMQIIDIYVLPSIWEGHPLVLLEAMACGKPILASNISGNRDAVEDGYTGYLVTPKDPSELAKGLTKLLNNEELRANMGQLGFEKYKRQFSIDHMVKDYENLYKECLFRNNGTK